MKRLAAVSFALLVLTTPAAGKSARPASTSWAAPQIAVVVEAGLMGSSAADFRPDDSLTWSELASVVASFGGTVAVTDWDRPVTLGELDAQLVALTGLRPAARRVRQAALSAGLAPTPWLGTETIARILGLRLNHLRPDELRELQLTEPATRAEAAFSLARLLETGAEEIRAVEAAAATFAPSGLSELQRTVLARALRLVGSPYVWAGTSEKQQRLFGKLLPGGFDCSGFVWRVYKLEPIAAAPGVGDVLKGRTSFAMSGEVPRSARIPRERVEPGDVVFFGSRGPRSRPTEVGHMGIYVGSGWMAHSSRYGTTLTPMTGWYQTAFAWARRPFAESGVVVPRSLGGRDGKLTT